MQSSWFIHTAILGNSVKCCFFVTLSFLTNLERAADKEKNIKNKFKIFLSSAKKLILIVSNDYEIKYYSYKSFISRLVWQIVIYLPDNLGLGKRGGSNS